jgi:hypothetical protein
VCAFVNQYDKTLNACYLKEKEEDVKTKTSRPILKTCFFFLLISNKFVFKKMKTRVTR